MMTQQEYERKVAKIRNNQNLTLAQRRHKIGMLDTQWRREMSRVQERNARKIQLGMYRKFVD